MAKVVLHSKRPIPSDAVLALFAGTGALSERSADAVEDLLAQGPAVGAWDGDQLVGFARAVKDGRLRAYVEDVVVARESRDSGIEEELVQALVAALDVEVVSVFAIKRDVEFYERLGFRATRQRVLHRRR
jgi:ribosomal protein S18 acetylase RimI-like enzyme